MAINKSDEQYIFILLDKASRNEASETELRHLDLWYDSFQEAPLYTDGMSSEEEEQAMSRLLNRIHNQIAIEEPTVKRVLDFSTIKWWLTIAASIILVIGMSLIFRYYKDTLVKSDIDVVATDDSNSATLTLASGKKIRLSNQENGELANEEGVSISKTKDGQLVYHIQETSTDIESYNTISTAIGESYQVCFSDGTSVWLNAATSLKFPTHFHNLKTRTVELEGEAYFDVAKNKNQPFVVHSKGQDVRVLGTQFNIKAYNADYTTETTLIEGKVQVSWTNFPKDDNTQQTVILEPGQQSRLNNKGIRVNTVDTESILAWRAGYLMFANESMEDVMKNLCRWYDIDVRFTSNAARKVLFYGTVQRYKNVSDVLDMLQLTGEVEFTIKDKQITVSKKDDT